MGWGDILEDCVPLGKTYFIDLATVKYLLHGQVGRSETVMRKFVMAYAEAEITGRQNVGWMPLELFEIAV